MKLTQKELKDYCLQEKTQVFNYRKAYQIEYCRNTGTYGLRELERYRKYNGIPYTKRGRYNAYSVEYAQKIINI